MLGVGTCTITASQAGNSNYNAAPSVTQSFTVTQAPQTIAFGAPGTAIFGATPFTISATASSGLSVTFSATASSVSVCSVSVNTVTIVGAGACSITAIQPGNANYLAATPVTQTFTVNPAVQSIVFTALPDVALPAASVALAATASSGLPVNFTSNSAGICAVSGSTVTLLAVGSCLITATQTGNANYAPAAPVTQLFRISAPIAAPVITQGGVVPVYSTAATIQPGEWVSIYGTNLATGNATWQGNFPTSLGGTSVTINGKAAYLWFVSPTQINLQAPADSATGTVSVVITTATGSSRSTVTLAQFAPSFCLLNDTYASAIVPTPGSPGNSGAGYDLIGPAGAFLNPTRPLKAGEVVQLYGVGFGPTNPVVPAGQAFSGAAASVTVPVVTIGGIPATVNFAGIVQAGLFQLNVVVPNAGSGNQLLRAIVGGVTTPNNVFLTLQ